MTTISLRLVVATTTAACHVTDHPLPAAAAAASAHGTDLGPLIFLVLAVLFIAALSSAARGLAALLSELLRAATAVTSALFVIVIAVVFAIAFLAHH
jgi:hypothetical protein